MLPPLLILLYLGLVIQLRHGVFRLWGPCLYFVPQEHHDIQEQVPVWLYVLHTHTHTSAGDVLLYTQHTQGFTDKSVTHQS